MSVSFIIGVVWRTRRAKVRVWRTSPLAAVFLGIGREEREQGRNYKLTEDGLSKRAESLSVRLQVTEREARMVRGG